MNWADYSSDDEPDDRDFTTPRVIFVFSDAADWPTPTYRETVHSIKAMEKVVNSNKKRFRWWHGFSPEFNEIYSASREPFTASDEYLARIRRVVPPSLWKQDEPRLPLKELRPETPPSNMFDALSEE
jgi:hypothetical protein